jgi:hypothetical protein
MPNHASDTLNNIHTKFQPSVQHKRIVRRRGRRSIRRRRRKRRGLITTEISFLSDKILTKT